MNVKCDIAIIGAGPVGLAEACLLKAMNPRAEICVLEKRAAENSGDAKSRGRSHGLVIGPDSIVKLQKTLLKAMTAEGTNKVWANAVYHLFDKFKKKKFISTHQIESDLAQEAAKMGIKVLHNTPVNSVEHIKDIKASVIIAADGTHSKLRDLAITAEKVHKKTYQYLVELKFKTPIQPEKNYNDLKISSKVASTEQVISIGHQARTPSENGLVEATELLLVDEQTHNLLLRNDTTGKVTKGGHLNPWSEEEIFQYGRQNKKIGKIYRAFQRKLNGRKPLEYKVTTIPLSVYRSKSNVSVFDNKVVAAVGDASSGLILYRGLNKGWIEAAYLAESVTAFLKRGSHSKATISHSEIPVEFSRYQRKAQNLFASEKFVVELKNIMITIGQLALKIIFTPLALLSTRFKVNRKDVGINIVKRAFVPNIGS